MYPMINSLSHLHLSAIRFSFSQIMVSASFDFLDNLQSQSILSRYIPIYQQRLNTLSVNYHCCWLDLFAVAPEAPEILEIDLGFDNMEIHWQALISNRDSPVLDYLAKVKEKDESHGWKNCTQITVQTSSSSLVCVMNDLRSDTVYIVQVGARNVVGYSQFTEVEVQTKKPAGNSRFHSIPPHFQIFQNLRWLWIHQRGFFKLCDKLSHYSTIKMGVTELFF